MFIKDSELIKIKIYYIKKNHKYIAYTEDEFKKKKNEEKKKEYSELNLKLLPLGFGLYNELQDKGMIDDGGGNKSFNFKVFRENKLRSIIKEWDAYSDNGNIVPINSSVISHLSPDIADAILRQYDIETSVSEKEQNF